VWIIEAARLLASGTSGNEYAYELLNMAMPEIVGATHPWRDAVRSPDDDETVERHAEEESDRPAD